ncbi:uncharacterized protein EV420DRAFT_221344 [Desarmillaria tabescens]|uniref:Uncharacterized protein n=1 Tax=Armillaria tabescens TaxID=1929756 RepID=A0AA39N7V0_ARMTA|nr:uncharacterized protein EV420DRAFT_221344 [Desarmillaria tabescens]KAK0460639.1 hypothetical protein EV420DRAFT_221344 [Desarmillaria tabescens]
MFKCCQLSKLPKLNGKPSVVFRGCKPGALTGAFPHSDCYAVRLDPKHPALRVNLKILPLVSQPFLSIKAIPFGILTKPENAVTFERPVELWKSRVARLKDPPTEHTDISLPVHLLMPKKTVHKKKYLRVEIARKVKTAIALIFSRGLDVGSDDGLVLNDRQTRGDCDKLIVDGWSYVISPQLEIYRMPFEDLVKGLRKSLLQISSGIRQLEQQWAAKDKCVYSGRQDARFTSARPGNPTLAEMRAKMRENEEKRRRVAENELQFDDFSAEKTAVLETPLNEESLTSNVSLSSNPSYSLPDHLLDESRQHDASSSFVSAAVDSFNDKDKNSRARVLEQNGSPSPWTNQIPEIPLETVRDGNATIAPSLKKKDNSSWISFLDDVVEDAEKDILFAPIEDEEELDIQDPQKNHRYASRWDGFHANHGSRPARRDNGIPATSDFQHRRTFLSPPGPRQGLAQPHPTYSPPREGLVP